MSMSDDYPRSEKITKKSLPVATLRSVDIEEEVLGTMIKNASARKEAGASLLPEKDFTTDTNIALYRAIMDLHNSGVRVEISTLTDIAQTYHGGIDREIVEKIVAKGTIGSITRKIDILSEKTTRREIESLCRDVLDMVVDPGRMPEEIVSAIKDFNPLHLSSAGQGGKTYSLYDYLNVEADDISDWVIPGILAQKDRLIVTGDKAIGKSTLLRQIAFLTSLGIHPFTFEVIEAKKVMLVDFENSARTLRRELARLYSQTLEEGLTHDWERSNLTIWDRNNEDGRILGFNPYSRFDRNDLASAIERNQPDLVVIGPIYKMMKEGEGSSEIGAEVLTKYLDELRSRFKVALIMEAHPNQPSATDGRWLYKKNGQQMRQSGSHYWARWPEHAVSLYKDPTDKSLTVELTKTRAEDEVDYPKRLVRGFKWPWERQLGFDD